MTHSHISPTAAAVREGSRRTDGRFGEHPHLEQGTFDPPAQEPARETTLQKYNHPSQRRNYCTLPTIDVEIVDEVHHCGTCHAAITFQPGSGPFSWHGTWVHTDEETKCTSRTVMPQAMCAYCNNDTPGTVKYRQDSWADVTSCSRCGGETGFAIGD